MKCILCDDEFPDTYTDEELEIQTHSHHVELERYKKLEAIILEHGKLLLECKRLKIENQNNLTIMRGGVAKENPYGYKPYIDISKIESESFN